MRKYATKNSNLNTYLTRYTLVIVGVGTGVIVGLVLFSVMITPIYADPIDDLLAPFRELHPPREQIIQEEIERLNEEYIPHGEDLVNFEEIREKEIQSLHDKINSIKEEITLLDGTISEQRKIIVLEQKKVNETWGDNSLHEENIKLKNLTDKKNSLLLEIKEIERNIENKTLLQNITKNNGKIIGIRIAEKCVSCPTYEDLLSMDNSNEEISGKLTWIDGKFQREKSIYTNPWRYYDTDDTIRVIVDPHYDLSQRIKMIVIENITTYTTLEDRFTSNGMYFFHKDRYIENCDEAHINGERYMQILGDTIYTLRNGCEDTKFNERIAVPLPTSPMDRTIFKEIKYQSWLKETKERCKVKC